jgi:protease I
LTRREVQLVIHDFDPNSDAYTEKNGRKLPVDLAFSEVDPSEYVALVIPGGRAPEYIRNDADFKRIVREFFADDKPVAQLCHAPLALAAAGVLEGRRTAAYPALEPDVTAAGAEYVDGAAVVDGVMVSARAWPDHPAWMREFVRLLREHAPAEPVAAGATA